MTPRIFIPLAVVVLASAAAGVGAWVLVPHRWIGPQISAYSDGHLTRVGPYLYCDVLDLNDCRHPQTQGQLQVGERSPVQLSVPRVIGRAPWRLLQVYEDNTTATIFRPGSRLAVTIPTVDTQRGRLTGIAVQLLTLVRDPRGDVTDVPHAEWSVRLVF